MERTQHTCSDPIYYVLSRYVMKKTKSPYTTWYYRGKDCIAQNGLTNSKRPECLILGDYPTHIKKGQGATVTDVRGIKYVDYIGSLGSNLLGHGVQRIADRIHSTFLNGSLYSVGSTIEVEAAERLKGLFPFIDKVKFLKTGTEACMAAVKIARAFTGREKILVDGYHGWSDIFIGPPGFGVDLKAAGNTHRGTNYTDHVLKLARGDYAAVVLEPVELDNSPSRRQWLQELRTVCDNTGTLLIFDEVITGFRFPGMSVTKYHGVTPDLICLGKAMGGGLPLSAVGGKTHIMECKEYFVSSTFAGDTLALSAFLEVCDMLNTVKYSIDDLWVKGEQFLERFNELAPDKIQLRGYPTRGAFFGNEEFKYAFWQEAARAGILFGPSWFYGFASPEHDDVTLSTCKDIINKVRTRKNTFTGIPPLKPFASKQRE